MGSRGARHRLSFLTPPPKEGAIVDRYRHLREHDLLKYVRIFAGGDGESHFEDCELELGETTFAPPAPPFLVSAPLVTSGNLFASMPRGWFGDWHPTPRRQFWFQLAGELEVEVSDGSKRDLGPGSIVLVEDV
jgi:mannose-6-phosphate isomerase-like protein (cupin superfamily)